MYVDPNSTFKMEQEVNEATAALKGILGIGSSRTTDSTAAVSTLPEMKTQTSEMATEDMKSSKKKKYKKKNKKATNEPSTVTPNKPYQNDSSDSKGNNMRTASTKKKKPQKKQNQESENYAWSAFQSSPDASKLPIPAFASPVQEKKVMSTPSIEEYTGLQENLPKLDAEQEYETMQKSSEETVLQPVYTEQPEVDNQGPEIMSPTVTEPSAENAPVSRTGVNLAALAAKPPPTSPSTGPAAHSPLTQLQSVQPASPDVASNSVNPPFITPPPMNNHYQQHHSPYAQPSLMPNHMRQFPPPPPPGYVTIHAQIPPYLLPGRQMIVTSPSGYPVQVAVPEGILPGMVIPVHVPAGPPMHMMQPGLHPRGGSYGPFGGGYFPAPPHHHTPSVPPAPPR